MATAVRMVTESGVAHLEPDPNDVATRGGKVSELDGMSAEYAMRALADHQRLIIDGQEYEFYGLRLSPVIP